MTVITLTVEEVDVIVKVLRLRGRAIEPSDVASDEYIASYVKTATVLRTIIIKLEDSQ